LEFEVWSYRRELGPAAGALNEVLQHPTAMSHFLLGELAGRLGTVEGKILLRPGRAACARAFHARLEALET
jgi:hypothetical protein